MSAQDICVTALTIWRENRGGGYQGMQSCCNVIQNRAKARNSTLSDECLRHDQFSSMTAKNDPQLSKGPNALNAAEWNAYLQAIQIASEADAGNLPDITGGATFYFAASMEAPPSWAASMVFTVEIQGQRFYRET